jgi:hypothetical protein
MIARLAQPRNTLEWKSWPVLRLGVVQALIGVVVDELLAAQAGVGRAVLAPDCFNRCLAALCVL